VFARVLAVVVVCNDYFASDQHVIPNFNEVRCSNMHEVADSNMSSDNDPGKEYLFLITRDCFQPEVVSSR
jgi:hypothetical protein